MYYTYIMELYYNDRFVGIKVGATSQSAEKRRKQILSTDAPLVLKFNNMNIISIQEYNTPHLMYAGEALLHEIASKLPLLIQERADYFTIAYGFRMKGNGIKTNIVDYMINKHNEISKFLDNFNAGAETPSN